MTFALRAATAADVPDVLPRTQALNAHEGIVLADGVLESALRRLVADPRLGGVWLVLDGTAPVGYAIVTYGYDLEFGGRDAYLTELWIDDDARGRGAGSAALELLVPLLQSIGLGALHLQVRPENPAMRLYERSGFVTSPRKLMTRRL